jgi:hypothetical protein
MKHPITQEYDYGCGIACFAFVTNTTYKQAATFLGEQQANSERFYCGDFVTALNHYGLAYRNKHLKPDEKYDFEEGTIVLIRRSKQYLVGHYLAYHKGQWMDPWVNSPYSKDIRKAKSGYRKRLPGKAMYALIPLGNLFR